MAKYSKEFIEKRFAALCKLAGKSQENWMAEGRKNTANIGSWYLDNSPQYGGYEINEIIDDGGAVRQVTGYCNRLKPAAFVAWMEGFEVAFKMAAPRTFRLLGRETVFKLVKTYMAAGDIPSVKGVTLDGKRETCARAEDILWLS